MLSKTFTLASGSAHLERERNIFDLSLNLSNLKATELIERISRLWPNKNFIGSGATLLPKPTIGTGSLVFLVGTENLASAVAKIQSVFSLNISEVAKVIRVQRPTIYAWVNGDSIPHGSNYKRLQDLYRLAEAVQANFGTKLGKLQKGRNVGGLTLIDLLSREKINQEEVIKHMNTLVGVSGQQETRVRSFREMAKAANKNITTNQDSQKAIDHLTGKRVTED
jgi:hypothetical protein